MSFQKQLQKYFSSQKSIVAVYLFGSHAKGRAHANSDVDLAVLFHDSVSPKHYFDRSLKMSCDLMKLLNHNQVDVVVLNTATPVLKSQIYKYGKSVFSKNPSAAIRFKAKSILEYLDMAPVRSLCESVMKKRALQHG